MYKYEDDELMDVDEMYAEEIVLEEGTLKSIRERAAQTGENPDDLAKEFKEYLKDTFEQIPEEVKDMQRLILSYARKNEYKEAI